MVVKMRKWSPESAATRKFKVSVKTILKLEGFTDDDVTPKFVAIKIKWKGEPKFFQLYKKELSSEKILKKGVGEKIIQWDADHWFENFCTFSTVPNHDHKFGVWEIGFNVLYGEKMGSKAKMGVIGKASMNIAEIVGKMENSSVHQKLPLSLQIDGVTIQATLTVLLNFVEIKEPQYTTVITRSGGSTKALDCNENSTGRRRALSQEEVRLDESDKSTTFDTKDATQTSFFTKSRTFTISRTQLNSDNKKDGGWFSWKNRGLSFKRAKTKEEKKFDEKTETCINVNRIDESENQEEANLNGAWEVKELISRDGQTKFKASVFFASFDQCSDKAAGESACTALVAFISHWLHANIESMPNRLEFDNLIIQGSSEWRKLCEDVIHVNNFPNRHFDLETVLRVDIRPLYISHDKSYVGFFDPEKFESLKGAMSFDDIWNEISSNDDKDDDFCQRIYIVSWNDHFFVLKTEAKAYYIIDTLGERLYEGCKQAYILRFDDSVVMHKTRQPKSENARNEDGEENETEEIICSGKECCREFIKRFYAAIPLKELEEQEIKKTVSYFSLHQRLQIEFNYSCSSSPASSLTSSPFSSMDTSTSSPLRDKECNLQL